MMCIAGLPLKFPFPSSPLEAQNGKESGENRGKQGKMAVLKAGKTRSPGKFRGIPGENQTKLLDRMACIYMCNRPRANYFVICALGTSVTIITSFVIFLRALPSEKYYEGSLLCCDDDDDQPDHAQKMQTQQNFVLREQERQHQGIQEGGKGGS